MYMPPPCSSLLAHSCQRLLRKAHVVLLPQIQHFDCVREALALPILRDPHHSRQLSICLGRFKIDVPTNDVTGVQFRPLSGVTAKKTSRRHVPLAFFTGKSWFSHLHSVSPIFCVSHFDLDGSSRSIFDHAITILL